MAQLSYDYAKFFFSFQNNLQNKIIRKYIAYYFLFSSCNYHIIYFINEIYTLITTNQKIKFKINVLLLNYIHFSVG